MEIAGNQTNDQENSRDHGFTGDQTHRCWLQGIIQLHRAITHDQHLEQPTEEEAEPDGINGVASADQHADR